MSDIDVVVVDPEDEADEDAPSPKNDEVPA